MSELDWHPLFPPKEDDEEDASPPEIQEIHVQRKENGRLFTAPRVFFPNELTSMPALYAEFGGGEYILLARNSRKQITGRTMVTIPGPPKPMFDDGTIPGQPSKSQPTQTPMNPMMAMMGGMGSEGGIMPLIMMMMQNMMTQQQEASRQSMQMFMGFMQTMATGSQADKQAAQEAMNRQAERDARTAENQMKMMVELTQARGAGNSTGGEESFFKGVEFMKHFATQQVEMLKATAATGKGDGGFDLESLAGSLIEAFQGFKAFQGMAMGANPEIPAPSEVVS